MHVRASQPSRGALQTGPGTRVMVHCLVVSPYYIYIKGGIIKGLEVPLLVKWWPGAVRLRVSRGLGCAVSSPVVREIGFHELVAY